MKAEEQNFKQLIDIVKRDNSVRLKSYVEGIFLDRQENACLLTMRREEERIRSNIFDVPYQKKIWNDK